MDVEETVVVYFRKVVSEFTWRNEWQKGWSKNNITSTDASQQAPAA